MKEVWIQEPGETLWLAIYNTHYLAITIHREKYNDNSILVELYDCGGGNVRISYRGQTGLTITKAREAGNAILYAARIAANIDTYRNMEEV